MRGSKNMNLKYGKEKRSLVVMEDGTGVRVNC